MNARRGCERGTLIRMDNRRLPKRVTGNYRNPREAGGAWTEQGERVIGRHGERPPNVQDRGWDNMGAVWFIGPQKQRRLLRLFP